MKIIGIAAISSGLSGDEQPLILSDGAEGAQPGKSGKLCIRIVRRNNEPISKA